MRVAFDLDGVLADLAGAHRAIHERLRPRKGPAGLGLAESAAEGAGRGQSGSSRLERRVWREIQLGENFWQTLDALEPGVIRRLHEESLHHRWETFFVTQRPATAGESVQRQSQLWLVAQGFSLPAVIVHRGSRGRLAAALELDFLVDDTVENCVDAVEESDARSILVCRREDPVAETNARRLGIEVCRTAAEALGLVGRATAVPRRPLIGRVAKHLRPTPSGRFIFR